MAPGNASPPEWFAQRYLLAAASWRPDKASSRQRRAGTAQPPPKAADRNERRRIRNPNRSRARAGWIHALGSCSLEGDPITQRVVSAFVQWEMEYTPARLMKTSLALFHWQDASASMVSAHDRVPVPLAKTKSKGPTLMAMAAACAVSGCAGSVHSQNAHAGSRTRVTSMGGLYDAATQNMRSCPVLGVRPPGKSWPNGCVCADPVGSQGAD